MSDQSEPPLSRDEIATGDPLQPAVAQLVLQQSTALLSDLLDAKKQFENKAAGLMSGTITIAIALVGAAALGKAQLCNAGWFVVAGIGFSVSASFCAWVLRDQTYGASGVHPQYWLTDYWLRRSGENGADRMAAIFAHDLERHISASIIGNNHKADAISAALALSFASGVIAVVTAGFEVWGPACRSAAVG